MSLLQATELIQDEIITVVKCIWEIITLCVDQETVVKDYELFFLSSKEEDGKNVETIGNSSSTSTKSQPMS